MLRALPIENTNIKVQKYGKKTIMSSSFKKALAKNFDDYEIICFIHVLFYSLVIG